MRAAHMFLLRRRLGGMGGRGLVAALPKFSNFESRLSTASYALFLSIFNYVLVDIDVDPVFD